MPKRQCQNSVKVLAILTLFLLTICFTLSAQTRAFISHSHLKNKQVLLKIFSTYLKAILDQRAIL
ncbi:hypothetical protein DRO91_03225 [Candidatus Heimdallarchaeota archaeon]|nr:MAG: hypothetical protein DRO63_03215 [Candidatus Gerdarchaeota archaeon]RLI70701.1 MAG: hypothetical protein DRP02_07080 [Candidatus Gerdarchaeota archaeon]RLI73313.1 MAG: hypothetical protein DRO91_03225 [Candidatus Heimdallarchaeota archaeon]